MNCPHFLDPANRATPSQTLDDQLFMKRHKAYLTTEASEKEGSKEGEALDR